MAGSIMLHWRERLRDEDIFMINQAMEEYQEGDLDSDELRSIIEDYDLTPNEVEKIIEDIDK